MFPAKSIVIIEDDRDDQELLLDVMQQLGVIHPLVFFEDCETAYEHLLTSKVKPFLILCDINLPKLNGIEFKRRLDGDERLRSLCIPFVFLTTSDDASTIREAYEITNLQGFFQKENKLEQIKAQLKIILDYWRMSLHPVHTTK